MGLRGSGGRVGWVGCSGFGSDGGNVRRCFGGRWWGEAAGSVMCF